MNANKWLWFNVLLYGLPSSQPSSSPSGTKKGGKKLNYYYYNTNGKKGGKKQYYDYNTNGKKGGKKQPIQQEVCLHKDATEDVYENSKGSLKKCSWVANGKTLKNRQYRCRKKGIGGKKVIESCPKVCGSSAGLGPCKFLIDTKFERIIV